MITGPLELSSRLSRPPRDLDVLHWVNAAAACLLFAVAGSRFVLAPGLTVATDAKGFSLPEAAAGQQRVRTAPDVLGYRRDNVVLFRDGIYRRLEDLRQPLREYAALHPGAVLLVLADRQVSFQAMSELAQLAREAGLAGIHVAGQREAVRENTQAP